MEVTGAKEVKRMQRISFRGSDDGFTVLGTILLILVFLLVLPFFAQRTQAEYRDVSRQYEEMRSEIR